ncbi:MAG: porin [Methylophilaceae bacterium]|nr:porin [Methylophilaceae bacterium]
MNKTLKLAVAAALLAGASSANAGIMIPAGDWTLDIGGIVNAYYTSTSYSGDNAAGTGPLGLGTGAQDTTSNITTGLLPNYLSVSGKTRQNDLDVAFTISINPGASTTNSGIQGGGANQENRQAFLTFGDASWGSMKLGKDLGIYASDAILNDMTLLGVGSGAGNLAGNTTTLGRIGTGFMYADWKSQVAYTSPNFNGFNFTVGLTQAWNAVGDGSAATASTSASSTGRGGSSTAYEGKASYAWTGDVAGKVWTSFISQKVEGLTSFQGGAAAVAVGDDRANAWDIGTTVNVAGLGLTGYYGQGDGIGQTLQLNGGFDAAGKSRDSDQWYVQATYAIPTGTKLGFSYGQSTLEGNSGEAFDEVEDSMTVFGAYHPITKHLNLVAEYAVSERDLDNVAADAKAKAKTISLGAILFF